MFCVKWKLICFLFAILNFLILWVSLTAQKILLCRWQCNSNIWSRCVLILQEPSDKDLHALILFSRRSFYHDSLHWYSRIWRNNKCLVCTFRSYKNMEEYIWIYKFISCTLIVISLHMFVWSSEAKENDSQTWKPWVRRGRFL